MIKEQLKRFLFRIRREATPDLVAVVCLGLAIWILYLLGTWEIEK